MRKDGYVYLKACLNGARTPDEHPALPVTAARIGTDIAAVSLLGVDAVHVHVKDPDTGVDTFGAAVLADVLAEARRAAPRLPVGVTTGAWAEPDVGNGIAAIRSWTVLPDFASVDWHDEGAELVAAALLDGGVGVEAGLWHADAVHAWSASPLRDECVRALLELQDGPDAADTVAEAARLLALTERVVSSRTRIVLHGEGSSCWPALRYAVHRGLGTRIGLEDTLLLPDGSPAGSNAALVTPARTLERQADGI